MSDFAAKGGPRRIQIEATVIRADGRVEQLGIVSDSAWRRFDPRRLFSARRIRRANAKEKN